MRRERRLPVRRTSGAPTHHGVHLNLLQGNVTNSQGNVTNCASQQRSHIFRMPRPHVAPSVIGRHPRGPTRRAGRAQPAQCQGIYRRTSMPRTGRPSRRAIGLHADRRPRRRVSARPPPLTNGFGNDTFQLVTLPSTQIQSSMPRRTRRRHPVPRILLGRQSLQVMKAGARGNRRRLSDPIVHGRVRAHGHAAERSDPPRPKRPSLMDIRSEVLPSRKKDTCRTNPQKPAIPRRATS